MEFDEKFKTYSNTDLLRVIENPNDYQFQAVETAKTIFSDRQLSEMEIKIARDELEIERQDKSKKEQQKIAVENKVINVGKTIFDHINPIQKETPTSEKTIRIISILFDDFDSCNNRFNRWAWNYNHIYLTMNWILKITQESHRNNLIELRPRYEKETFKPLSQYYSVTVGGALVTENSDDFDYIIIGTVTLD